MKELSLPNIALIYLVVINVVTFFMYGIDKWKAKKSKWRIREKNRKHERSTSVFERVRSILHCNHRWRPASCSCLWRI